jgi:hypothetical protein
MDVRFLVDDLNLQLKDPKPSASPSDVSKTPAPETARPSPEKKGFIDKMKEKVGLAPKDQPSAGDQVPLETEADFEDEGPGPLSGAKVSLSVDAVTLIPGALASGTVTFSDGVTGKWIVDQYGRPGFTEISKPGYRPSPADAQSFMQELSLSLQRKGF